MPAGYDSTARALALDPNDTRTDSPLPSWRNFTDRTTDDMNATYSDRLVSGATKFSENTLAYTRQASSHYRRLSVLQRILLALLGLFGIGVLVLFFKFGESLFAWIAPLAEGWREVRFGWLILWAATFVVSFPPLIGYSSCVTLAGFVYGLGKGWAIAATATILGSTTSFLLSRHLLSNFVHKLVAHDRRFAALALTLKHDGLKLLVMIRLCPLPYSLSNGAIATFPTVHWANFALATSIATPRLLIGVFIGSRLAKIADQVGEGEDTTGRFVNWMSILLSMVFGVVTAWFIYRQTKRRADELEALEGAANGGVGIGGRGRVPEDEVDLDSESEDGEAVGGSLSNPKRGANGNTYRDEPEH